MLRITIIGYDFQLIDKYYIPDDARTSIGLSGYILYMNHMLRNNIY